MNLPEWSRSYTYSGLYFVSQFFFTDPFRNCLVKFTEEGADTSPEGVFEDAPFNETGESVSLQFRRCYRGTSLRKEAFLMSFLDEFLALACDQLPDCCADGRNFYAIVPISHSSETVVLECDRCGGIQGLVGTQPLPPDLSGARKMRKSDFKIRYGHLSPRDWPFTSNIRPL
jgi:hypothetical protein